MKPFGPAAILLQQDVCGFCRKNTLKYTCPRCEKGYCLLGCYRGPTHRECLQTPEQRKILETVARYSGGKEGEWRYEVPLEYKDGVDRIRQLQDKEGNRGDAPGAGGSQKTRARGTRAEGGKEGCDGSRLGLDPGLSELLGDTDAETSDGSFGSDDERELSQLLESATIDELLRVLSPEQRARFEAMAGAPP